VGLLADGSIRHGAGAKPFHDAFNRFYFRNVDGIAFVIQQIADKGRFLFLIDQGGIFLKQVIIVRFSGYLQPGNGFRIPGMILSLNAVGIVPVVDEMEWFIQLFMKSFRERLQYLPGNIFHVNAFYLRRDALEVVVQHR